MGTGSGLPSADLAISKDATRPRLAAALTVLTARRRLLGNQQPRQPQTDGGGGAEQQDVLTTRIDRDGRRLLYQLSPLHFSWREGRTKALCAVLHIPRIR